jgi:hypothetical protein
MTTKNKIYQCECDDCRDGSDTAVTRQHQQMNLFLSRLNEPQRRWYLGMYSQQPDSPSDRQLAKITGMDEKTIRRGRRELDNELEGLPPERQRKKGGGRSLSEKKIQP